MSFIFYDTETTGVEHFFDQILQFAAILTDNNLNEIDRFEVRSRLQPDIVASPGAMNVTGVSADQLDDPSFPSQFQMACQIHQKLSAWGPAQFVGHNSISFDEKLLRSLFYKSLLPIYLTNTNGNTRLDTIKMLQSASIYQPEQLTFPMGNSGRATFKLDQLAPANGFNHANAHEAMSDVEATIFMCRRVRDLAPDIWSQYMRFSSKDSVQDFCETEDVFGLTEFYYGRPYTFLLHKIGVNPDDTNEVIAVDLSYGVDSFLGKSEQDLVQVLRERPKPLRRFRANALPGLNDGDEAHPQSRISDLSFADLEDRARRFAEHPELKNRLLEAYLNSKPEYELSPHIEEQMYNGFAVPTDEALFREFHDAEWSDRYDIVCQISEPRFRRIGEWIIFCEAPEYLSRERKSYWEESVRNRLFGRGEPCKALTLPDALQQTNDMLSNATGEKHALLSGHRERILREIDKYNP